DDVAAASRAVVTDQVAGGAAAQLDAGAGVAEGGVPGGAQADEVPLDAVAGGADQIDAGAGVAADDVAAAAGAVVADQGVLGALGELDADRVAHGRRPVSIRADVVAPDAVGAGTGQLHAPAVAGDDVAGRRRRAADQVARRRLGAGHAGDEHAEELADGGRA